MGIYKHENGFINKHAIREIVSDAKVLDAKYLGTKTTQDFITKEALVLWNRIANMDRLKMPDPVLGIPRVIFPLEGSVITTEQMVVGVPENIDYGNFNYRSTSWYFFEDDAMRSLVEYSEYDRYNKFTYKPVLEPNKTYFMVVVFHTKYGDTLPSIPVKFKTDINYLGVKKPRVKLYSTGLSDRLTIRFDPILYKWDDMASGSATEYRIAVLDNETDYFYFNKGDVVSSNYLKIPTDTFPEARKIRIIFKLKSPVTDWSPYEIIELDTEQVTRTTSKIIPYSPTYRIGSSIHHIGNDIFLILGSGIKTLGSDNLNFAGSTSPTLLYDARKNKFLNMLQPSISLNESTSVFLRSRSLAAILTGYLTSRRTTTYNTISNYLHSKTMNIYNTNFSNLYREYWRRKHNTSSYKYIDSRYFSTQPALPAAIEVPRETDGALFNANRRIIVLDNDFIYGTSGKISISTYKEVSLATGDIKHDVVHEISIPGAGAGPIVTLYAGMFILNQNLYVFGLVDSTNSIYRKIFRIDLDTDSAYDTGKRIPQYVNNPPGEVFSNRCVRSEDGIVFVFRAVDSPNNYIYEAYYISPADWGWSPVTNIKPRGIFENNVSVGKNYMVSLGGAFGAIDVGSIPDPDKLDYPGDILTSVKINMRDDEED